MKDIALKSLLLAGISVGISLTAYFGWFFVVLDLSLSKSPEAWGQFGSYIAGTVGVSMALATVWMLADTLRLQRAELGLTRKELELTRSEMQRAADAQMNQVSLNEKTQFIERSYYLIKSVENNLNTSYQVISKFMVHGSLDDSFYEKIHLYENHVKGFTDQYMLLIHYLEFKVRKDFEDDIKIMIDPIKYRYRLVISELYEAGMFKHYSESLTKQILTDSYFDNETFEGDTA